MSNQEQYTIRFFENHNETNNFIIPLKIVTYSKNIIIIDLDSSQFTYEVDKINKMFFINVDVEIRGIIKNNLGYIIYFQYIYPQPPQINFVKIEKFQ
jgi:hypothetical protein